MLIDDQAYLFDARLGPRGPRPRRPGRGDPRTDALSDPSILERMNLPGHGPVLHQPGRPAGQPDQDRHPDRFQPRLLLAQDEAAPARAGRQVPDDPLRDPAEQRDHFVHVLGPA